MLRRLERLAEVGDFLFHQQSGNGGLEIVRNALRRSVRAVRRAEGIVHVDLGQRRQRFRESRIVGFLFRVEAQVLEQQHLARLELARHLFGNLAHAIRREGHVDAIAEFLVEQLAQPDGHGPQRILRIRLALGPAQVRGQNHFGAVPQRVLDGGQRGHNARVVGNRLSVFGQRYVEINADKHPLVGQFDVFDRELGHSCAFR